uniref:protein-serine/threonine phosphatase n=1 Tax=Ursus maritimus TaxID=29073 RepID=A0A452U833_URSMA
MALVTVSRSPPASGHSTPVGPTQDQASKQKSWLQRRQSFAVLHGAVLRLQDGEDKDEAAEAGPEVVERPPGEEQPHGDQTDDGHGPQSPRKQEQSQHLHLMVELLRPQDDIRLAAQLEATRPPRLRYLLVVSTREHLSQDETVLLGVDFPDSRATLQVLHQACEAALGSGLVPGGSALAWAGHYQERLSSDRSCVNEWMAMADLESLRPPSAEPGRPSEQVQMEQAIRAELWEVLDTSDLESVTSKEIRQALELRLGRPLQQYRDFIDNQMLLLMAQQDRASRIFPHLYLGSEWNAANLEELQRNRVRHILNMAREIDNFYPERFIYHNVRLWDEESAQLLPHWKETHRFVEDASRQSHLWEQKAGGVSPEEPLVPDVSTPLPPLPPEPGGSGEVKAMGLQESHAAPKEEPGPRPRINLRGVMRSISLLEPSSEPESTSGASDPPEVFSSNESSEEDPPEPFPQLSKAEGGRRGRKGPWPALKPSQSVVALNSAALVATRTQAFQEQGEAGSSSTPRVRGKVVRQASVDGSGEEGEA